MYESCRYRAKLAIVGKTDRSGMIGCPPEFVDVGKQIATSVEDFLRKFSLYLKSP